MFQNIADKADAAESRMQETRGFMKQVRVAARRKYTPEEKVRIVWVLARLHLTSFCRKLPR